MAFVREIGRNGVLYSLNMWGLGRAIYFNINGGGGGGGGVSWCVLLLSIFLFFSEHDRKVNL